MNLKKALRQLNEMDDNLLPAKASRHELVGPSDDLNKKLLAKIDIIADGLADAFAEEGIDLDAKLIADDIRRDCGLMGGIVSTDELDTEGNPFDAATKQMHDMGPVDVNRACQMLLNVPPHEFVAVFMDGLRRNRGLLPGGERRALPNRMPRRIGEAKGKDYSYIDELVKKYASEIKEYKVTESEETLEEDLKGYFKNNYLKLFMPQGAEQMDQRMMKKAEDEAYKKAFEIAKIDPTFKGRDAQKAEDGLKKDKGSYFDWLMRLIKKGLSYEELMRDAHEYTDQLNIFDDQKRRNRLPKDKKDINLFKSLAELMEFLQSLGAGDNDEEGGHSDFKQDVRNPREALTRIVGVEDRDIPQDIQKAEDLFKFIGSNSEWDVVVPKNPWGAAILDRWGNGAGWCVGGMLGNNRGMEQIRQAQNYFSHYNGGGAQYVCFQRKDRNAARPTNKYLITLGPNGSEPETSAGYQFNDANNRTQYLGDHGWGQDAQDAQMDAFLQFLHENDLTDIIKNSEFKDCACFLNEENLKRLEAGEPYRYAGGKIRALFKDKIQKIIFEVDGKTYEVDAKANPQYFECESVEEMFNMYRLANGESYIFDGQKIKDLFRPMIKKATFSEGYNEIMRTRDARTGEVLEVVGIPRMAFKDCSNMEELLMPVEILYIGPSAFKGCNKVKIITPRFPDRPLTYQPGDVEFLQEHLYYDDGSLAFGGTPSGEGEE